MNIWITFGGSCVGRLTQQDLAAADLMWRPWERLLRHVETCWDHAVPKTSEVVMSSCAKPRSHGQWWMDQTHPWIVNHTRSPSIGQAFSCCFCSPVLNKCENRLALRRNVIDWNRATFRVIPMYCMYTHTYIYIAHWFGLAPPLPHTLGSVWLICFWI